MTSRLHPRHITPVLLGLVCAMASAGLPGIAAAAPVSPSAVTIVETSGFFHTDGTRNARLEVAGWCPDDPAVDIACTDDGQTDASDVPSGSGPIVNGLLGFDAARLVSPPVSQSIPRQVRVELEVDQAATYTVTVDLSSVEGTTFTYVPASAIPPADTTTTGVVTWTVDAAAGSEHQFELSYMVRYGDGRVDGIPAVVVTADHGPDDAVAAVHLRGDVPVTGADEVARTAELRFLGRSPLRQGQPVASIHPFRERTAPGILGATQISTTAEVTTLGDADQGEFLDPYVENVRPQGANPGLTSASGFVSDSSMYPRRNPDPFGPIIAGMGVDPTTGRGVADGEAARVAFGFTETSNPVFVRPRDGGPMPSDDDGQLVITQDDGVQDELGYYESYALIANPFGVFNPTAGETDNQSFLSSLRTVELSVEGGDIDRRDDPPNGYLRLDGSINFIDPYDVASPQEVPEGWDTVGVFVGTFAPANVVFDYEPGGSVTVGFEVDPGEFWLESDGLAWRWDADILTSAQPDEDVITSTEHGGLDDYITQAVPEGATWTATYSTPDGGVDTLELGPGIHRLHTNSLTGMRLLSSSPLDR